MPRPVSSCPFCRSEQAETDETSLRCPTCTRGQEWTADVVAVELGKVDLEIVYGYLSRPRGPAVPLSRPRGGPRRMTAPRKAR